MSYGSKHYEGNPYSVLSELKKWQTRLDAIRHGLVASHFSPEEVREIIANIREASAKLGEQPSPDNLSLIRELAKKLEELTEVMRVKSGWDKRFGANGDK